MFPFWEKVVAPLLGAAEARRLVEIGALRGEQTQLLLDQLGPDAELHVIDPVPDFDPEEHKKQFGDGYHFHRALSLDVLGDLPPMDGALVDGDHNWHTVRNELRLLAEVAEQNDTPLPVLVLHDVGWPYGRRDLYYDPSNIPAEFRQEWKRKGMRPGVERVVPIGGLNPTLANAVFEGGPRNGVRTGLDDFVAAHPRPIRQVVLPIYFGLAIAVEDARIVEQPAVGEFLDYLESDAGKDMLLELAESMRIEAMLFQHRIYFEHEAKFEALADRYLDSITRGLIDWHYLENELRLAHLADCLMAPRLVELPRLRDPVRHDTEALERLRRRRLTGLADPGPVQRNRPPDQKVELPDAYAYAPSGRAGLDHLKQCLDTVRGDHIRGDLASCGEGRGGTGIFLRAYLDAHSLDDRQVWMAGRWRAAADHNVAPDAEEDGLVDLRSDLNQIRDGFDRFGLSPERTHYLQGDLDATLADAPIEQLAVLHLGSGLGSSAAAVLTRLYPRLAVGGFIVVDAEDAAAAQAVDGFRRDHGVADPIEQVGAATRSWRKTTEVRTPASSTVTEPKAGSSRAPLATPPRVESCDLSVVAVFYDMAREAERTLHSLSRRYQEGIEDLDYEVLVVENGSHPDQRLGAEAVQAFGPEFRYIDMGDAATPSPGPALNRGVAESVGDVVALMVDGAHLLSPGVLREAMTGVQAYAPAIVAVQPWHLGPGQQGEAMDAGYDQTHEDALMANISWPEHGYDLFEIAHFHGDRDWLDGLWESNCLFVPRKQLEAAGAFDEGFDTPGGGFINLDIYERLGAAPEVKIVSILGEASFHQVHGGTTTNQADPAERRQRVFSYSERYAELRGRPYTGPEKPIHYVGVFHSDGARRTRARRMTGAAFDVDVEREGLDGPGGRPVPIPDELRDGFVAAYWRSRAWRKTAWAGQPVHNTPTDLFAYQELVTEIGPDWIIETGTRTGGRALFLANLCDLLDHGQVLSIDSRPGADRPEHPRITYLTGRAHDDEVLEQVQAIVGDTPKAMVILGTRGARRRMVCEFEAYAPFVPVGSYMVMEHTVLNGYPVDASFGPGPFEALRRIVNTQGDFAPDNTRERHGLSFNPGGFLQRVR